MKKISADDIIRWEPCVDYGWTAKLIRELLPEPVDPILVCDLRRWPDVGVEDRLWVLLRPEVMGDRDLRLFAADCAERALRRMRRAGREPHEESWRAVEVARRHAVGEATDEDLDAAFDAAFDAARAAAWEAAGDAARAAAWAAAGDAARAAARAAAWAAAWAAAGAPARAVERRWQLKRVAYYLREAR